MSVKRYAQFISLIVLFPVCAALGSESSSSSPQPIPLFNDNDLAGWEICGEGAESPAGAWSATNGVIRCTGGSGEYIRTANTYSNYILMLEWRWPEEPADSCVLLNLQNADAVRPPAVAGELTPGRAGGLRLFSGAGLTVNDVPHQTSAEKDELRLPKSGPDNEKPAGEWNRCEILCYGDVIRMAVNDVEQIAGYDATLQSGRIGLMSSGGPVEFRKIRIFPFNVHGNIERAELLTPSPYDPEGSDEEAIREALNAQDTAGRLAALEKVSSRSVATFYLVQILRYLELLGPEDGSDIIRRIEQQYTYKERDAETGEWKTHTRFPSAKTGDRFYVHPLIGTYEGDGRWLQVVPLPGYGFFAIWTEDRFWSATPELAAVGTFMNRTSGSATGPEWSLTLEKDEIRAVRASDGEVRVLNYSPYVSPTMGSIAPPNADLLIDTEGRPIAVNTEWVTVDRALQTTTKATGALKEASGTIRFHLEFRTPCNPGTYDQMRGNSGLFIGPYEIQINDNYGFAYAKNRCGGLYFLTGPTANACLPPTEWQTIDGKFVPDVFDDAGNLVENGRMTVWLNGVKIHDKTELIYEDAKKQLNKKPLPTYPIWIQYHANILQFRNFWWAPSLM